MLRRAVSLAAALALIAGLGAQPVSGGPAAAEAETEAVETAETFVDTDGDFAYQAEWWPGPSGYVIVIPAGDTAAKESAEYLKDYYTRVHGVTLRIVTDEAAPVEREILIGGTNREESDRTLRVAELSVALKGKKLVFSGGHAVTVNTAVKRFTRLMPDVNVAFTFSLTTDFSATARLAGYEYVWGDEFEDWYDLDFGKWNFRLGMSGAADIKTVYDRDVIDVADGRLKLSAVAVTDPETGALSFKVPYSVATNETMNYVYGYAEIRARVPFYKGIWPSFWGGTACDLKAPHNPDWHAEIDVFENFGTVNMLRPTIHKWYDSTKYNGLLGVGDSDRAHFASRGPYYTFSDHANLSNEYHIYGYEWTPEELNMYIDGEKYACFNITESFDALSDMSMFQDPQYHQFNCHVYTHENSSQSSFIFDSLDMLPSCFYIDYFRLYQKPGVGELYTDTGNAGRSYSNRTKEIVINPAGHLEPWDGSIPTAAPEYAGAGTQDDPYIIGNGTQLYWAVSNENAGVSYKLDRDIILNDIHVTVSGGTVTAVDGDGAQITDFTRLHQWNMAAENAKYFKGVLDGDGHIIRGLVLARTRETNGNIYNFPYALIPKADNAEIRNLGIEDSYIHIESGSCGATAAGFVGTLMSAQRVTVESCYLGESVWIYGDAAGGFIGNGNSTAENTVTNCYSLATLAVPAKGNQRQSGAIIGGSWNVSGTAVSNCYANTNLYGNAQPETVNCFENVTAQGDGAIVALAGIGDAFVRTGGYPALRVFTDYADGPWNGLGERYTKGSGTEADPYLIENAAQLAYVIYDTAGTKTAAYYKLTNDIYLNDVGDGWLERSGNMPWISTTTYQAYGNYGGGAGRALYGHYDGDGHVIYGIYYPEDAATPDAGLFPIFANGEIKNIGISHSQIAANQCAGGLIGLVKNNTGVTVSGCFADDTVTVTQRNRGENYAGAGGLIGQMYDYAIADISDCYSAAVLTARRSADRQNGIIASVWKCRYTVKNCYSLGALPFYIGGSSYASTCESDAYRNVYTDVTPGYTLYAADAYRTLDRADMTGEDALAALEGFDGEVWYAVKDEAQAPMLRLRGVTLRDADENGRFEPAADLAATRRLLLFGGGAHSNGDLNRDGRVDIRDLIAMKKYIAGNEVG